MNSGRYEQLMELIRERRSIRRFVDRPVPPELVKCLVEAARWAPSASNRQPYRILLVNGHEIREALLRAVREGIVAIKSQLRSAAQDLGEEYLDSFTLFAGAPVLLAFIHRLPPDLLGAAQAAGRDSSRRAEDDALSSCAAAITQLLLAAHALGLGACWMTGPLQVAQGLDTVLRVPRGWALNAFVPVGYPAEQPEPPPRRSCDELLRRLE